MFVLLYKNYINSDIFIYSHRSFLSDNKWGASRFDTSTNTLNYQPDFLYIHQHIQLAYFREHIQVKIKY